MTAWRLAASDTHLYPGARLRCLDDDKSRVLHDGDAALVEFSDGVAATAALLEVRETHAVMAVDAHHTARGTAIAARRWRLAPTGIPGELRVLR
jgi:hypothetical protein